MPRTAAASSSGWLPQRGPWLSYSVGMTITDATHHTMPVLDAELLAELVARQDGSVRVYVDPRVYPE